MTTDCFNITCRGAWHEQEGIPCEDCSLSVKANGITIAVVCDGHGAEQYFRSKLGSKFATEAVKETVMAMVDDNFSDFIKGKPFTAYGPMRGKDVSNITDMAYLMICNLALNVIQCWDEKVKRHVETQPLTDEEAMLIPENLAEAFRAGKVFNFAYGTTLLAYVQTNDCWFAFQIGDGKIITFVGDTAEVTVMDDELCHDNITTSLCDNDALDEMRISYEGDGVFPEAVFLCTDGLEKAFESDDELASYYWKMLGIIKNGGKDVLVNKLEQVLPDISEKITGDDISIACVFNAKRDIA